MCICMVFIFLPQNGRSLRWDHLWWETSFGLPEWVVLHCRVHCTVFVYDKYVCGNRILFTNDAIFFVISSSKYILTCPETKVRYCVFFHFWQKAVLSHNDGMVKTICRSNRYTKLCICIFSLSWRLIFCL